MDKTIIGIDNGVTGSIGIIKHNGTTAFIETPVFKCLSYTKEPQHIQRIDWQTIVANMPSDSVALIERPMVNPKAFKATQSALRALEATIICLEYLEIIYSYIDSKEWQREFFASLVIGHDDMKKASMEMGIEMFPNHALLIKKHGDADGLFIAEYLRRKLGK